MIDTRYVIHYLQVVSFSSLNGIDWSLLPSVTEEEKRNALAITSRFLGDLAFEASVRKLFIIDD